MAPQSSKDTKSSGTGSSKSTKKMDDKKTTTKTADKGSAASKK